MNDCSKEKRPNRRLFYKPEPLMNDSNGLWGCYATESALAWYFLRLKYPKLHRRTSFTIFLSENSLPTKPRCRRWQVKHPHIYLYFVGHCLFILHCCCLAQLIFGLCFHLTEFFHWQPPEVCNGLHRMKFYKQNGSLKPVSSFCAWKNMIYTLETFFWACDRSHSGVEILVHVPSLQHSGIPEYVKKKTTAK